ncbi:unnamed protein product [Cylicocyclus nassatus]|uniref:Lysozyme n=1 Tax=Cylicocyclus nassatus TaxID=53992 RepID=A0AA36HCS7_CYLNA|nr:unnamed protein product [Cylicocyclus nassatus]
MLQGERTDTRQRSQLLPSLVTSITMLLFILPALLAVFIQQASAAANVTNYAYALDIDKAMTVSTFKCLQKLGYSAVFIRAYDARGKGSFDTNAPRNVYNAYDVGLGAEVYMSPQPKSTKTGAVQCKEMLDGLKRNSVNIKTIWVQVTSPANWGTDIKKNLAFLNDIARTALSSGIKVGYYTNVHEWNQITKNTKITTPNTPLWYWNTNGAGPSGETPADFKDFRPFGGFEKATVKQFGQSVSICGVLGVNRDVFDAAEKQIFMIAKQKGTYVV